MPTETEQRQVAELIWREDLYPRSEPDSVTIQRYANDLNVLPAIEVNQRNEIIDGYHRWTAHRKEKAEAIDVFVTETKSDADLLALACERNAKHGLSFSLQEKKSLALRLYADGTGRNEEEIARLLSIKSKTVSGYLARRKKDLKAERNRRIFYKWLACKTEDEIADDEGPTQRAIHEIVENQKKSDMVAKLLVFSEFNDPDWSPPLYNIWKQQTKTNAVSHFGNSEPMILDNLLYMYTEPFDIVIDPFAGGGSTIDVCKKRLRRYWVSDRLPIVERNDIRQWDVLEGPPPLHKRWGNVKLLFLDPPYWIQAKGKYSNDPQDLANMSIDDFYETLSDFILNCAGKMKQGAYVALLMGPSQWPIEEKHVVDHTFDVMQRINGNLDFEIRIVCPYESQQYNGNQVKWAKENRRVLVLNRELSVWRIQ